MGHIPNLSQSNSSEMLLRKPGVFASLPLSVAVTAVTVVEGSGVVIIVGFRAVSDDGESVCSLEETVRLKVNEDCLLKLGSGTPRCCISESA